MAIFYTRKANDYYNYGDKDGHRKVLDLVNICDYGGTTKHNGTKYNVFRVAGDIPQWLLDKYGDIILTELPNEKQTMTVYELASKYRVKGRPCVFVSSEEGVMSYETTRIFDLFDFLKTNKYKATPKVIDYLKVTKMNHPELLLYIDGEEYTAMEDNTYTIFVDTYNNQLTWNGDYKKGNADRVRKYLVSRSWVYSEEAVCRLRELWDGTWTLVIDGTVYSPNVSGVDKLIRDIPNTSDVLSVMSDEAPTTTNASGGKQSHLGAAFELLPPDALTQVAVILEHGAKKYGIDNWRLIPRHDHLRHALGHIFAYLRNKDTKDLQHAACRILFSLETK
ncbi:hypothetical protein LPP2_g13 [Leptolyngbya phage LPP-2, strain SPI]|uniref:dATP/dGTP diphosphohydrolase N-terminal domain-containing protein n=1 Tax=Leptolyngbya phage LPP-2, strain SPI TaxID=2996053 RepID=A0A9Y1GSB9_9CAUD|nr:hypothetical protein LPP2_g13 [Leptolyngbya phage LPP-2 st. SPI]